MDKTENEIIAEFMGFSKCVTEHDTFWKENGEEYTINSWDFHNLPFDTSWDWLMPVVEKIEITIRDTKWIKGAWSITDLPITTKKEEVYKYAMDFIKWFNSQNNGQ